mmetsp:Transcript_741/g.1694  ORF Transcript_741/g.1694 Transcript_741/m.1694 type:complete len:335 (-) Transcript_741:104-1108(-)
MKIFATRTKKKAVGPRTVNKSDPVVEELLKKDPSEWNAKERRMVKRYQKRKETDTPETADETEKTEDIGEPEAQKENIEQEEKDGDENNKSISDDSDEGSSSGEDESDKEEPEEEEVEVEEQEENDSEGESSSDNNAEDSTEAKAEQSTIEEKPDAPEDDGKVGKDHEIWSVLDKLNSKQKRTLTRKLERLGTAVLEEVEQEANKILDETMPIEEAPAAPKRDLPEATSEAPTKKRRKKQADWSSLTPEERLRREDQRRKQQEAAERKARGESAIKPGHKRPLNSARRRANRRKPKWEKKAPSERPDISNYKQEHHSSGFTHRKTRKQPQETSW